jgi:hypothetical protein
MTVVLVFVTAVSFVEFPRNKAIRMIRNTAPPTAQTQGCIYQSVVVVVVVDVLVVLTEPVLSCAAATTSIKLDARTNINLYAMLTNNCFIPVDCFNEGIKFCGMY